MADSTIENLVRQSRFIISGTIERLAAATMPDVPVTDSTAVVRVDDVLYAPPQFSDYKGREITVLLADTKNTGARREAVFFTNAWLYGSSLAVVEVGRVSSTEDISEVRRQIMEAELNIADDQLRDRLARADLVLGGSVASVEPLREVQRRMPVTEHNPDWWQADIRIGLVVKGQFDRKAISVLFPNSTDEMWIDSPKFRPGQEGIWILQRNQEEKGWPSMRVEGYTALHPLDFQPPDQLDRIRKLLGRG